MSGWLRFENSTAENPKLVALSDRAFRLWFNACCYCSRALTDGVVPAVMLPMLGARSKRAVTELIDAGLLDVEDADTYRIHDYLEFNPSREQIQQMQGRGQRRTALYRDSDLRRAIRERDGDVCRYCGIEVSWSDRRGPHGGTYDHVDPDGPNTLENLVVACRGCNSSKGNRRDILPRDLDPQQIRSKSSRARDRSVDAPLSLSSKTTEDRDPASERELHPQAHSLSQLLADLIRQRDPKARVRPDSDGWVRDMRLLIADRHGDVAEVERVVRWSQADSFWQGVILSPGKLREKFTQLLLKARQPANGGRRPNASDLLRALDGGAA